MDLHVNHLGEVDIKDLRGSFGTEPGGLHGDFYCEHDDVVRGAQLSSAHDFGFGKEAGYAEHEGGAGAGAGFHEDAFETLPVDRHLLHGPLEKDAFDTLLADPHLLHGPPEKDASDTLLDDGQLLHGPLEKDTLLDDMRLPHGPPSASARFSDQAGLPATLPCYAAVTSIAIEDASPADVATFVHAFLTTSVRAIVTKVCPQKFAMKAEVFHDVGSCPMSCTLKARVFRAKDAPCEEQRLVVEFQRRAGDSLAFNGIFRLARGALLRRFAAA